MFRLQIRRAHVLLMHTEVFGKFSNIPGVSFDGVTSQAPFQKQISFKATNPG